MRILNAAKVGTTPPNSVYIGRPGPWGIPFTIGRDGDRTEVIDKYRVWILRQSELMAGLWRLKDKDLVCWCAPEACHGEVLLALVESYEKKEKYRG